MQIVRGRARDRTFGTASTNDLVIASGGSYVEAGERLHGSDDDWDALNVWAYFEMNTGGILDDTLIELRCGFGDSELKALFAQRLDKVPAATPKGQGTGHAARFVSIPVPPGTPWSCHLCFDGGGPPPASAKVSWIASLSSKVLPYYR